MEKTPSLRILSVLYGPELLQKIQKLNVLVVGAGGIGCELVKSLGKSGYTKFTLIDYDMIEVSNLSRQFYFRPKHIKKSKADITKEVILGYNPNLEVESYHAKIQDERFDIHFFRKFDYVFCALDNKDAREHLGRMCILSGRDMIDAGTQGHSGQVNTSIRGLYECNNCRPIPPGENFAFCSIRTRPEQPIHCITWARHLYEVLFGPQDENNFLSKMVNLTDFLSVSDENTDNLRNSAIKLFNFLFCEEIEKAKASADPTFKQSYTPVSYRDALTKTEDISKGANLNASIESQKILPISRCAEEFIESFIRTCVECKEDIGMLKFDKDDDVALTFVNAATNLRAFNFMDPNPALTKLIYMPPFDVKSKAGNLIPVVGSTNAIVAGVQMTEVLKLIQKRKLDLRKVWLANNSDSKLSPRSNTLPKLDCDCCSYRNAYISIHANYKIFTMKHLLRMIEKDFAAPRCLMMLGSLVCYDPFDEDPDYVEQKEEDMKKTFDEWTVEWDRIKDRVCFNFLSGKHPFTYEVYIQRNDDIDRPYIIEEFCQPESFLEKQKEFLKQMHTKSVERKLQYYQAYIF